MIEKHVDKNLTIPTGPICNNFCRFCMEADRSARRESVEAFTKNRIYSVLDQNTHLERVIFASGEPTLNPDLARYVKHAKKRGYQKIAIISNGRRYAYRSFCEELVEAGVNEFIISLHGHEKKIHEDLTRAPGSFAQTTQGLANISALRHKLSKILVSHVVNKKNYLHLEDFLAYLRDFMVDHVSFLVVQPRGANMEKDFFELMPRYRDVARQIEKIIEKCPGLCVSNISAHRRYLSILDLPLCLSDKIVSHIGFGEVRLIEKEGQMKEITNLPHKIKGKKCARCCYEKICEGVFKNYVEKFGWEEFKPVKG